jgi:hypothetical protein
MAFPVNAQICAKSRQFFLPALECGEKRSVTPLWMARALVAYDYAAIPKAKAVSPLRSATALQGAIFLCFFRGGCVMMKR